MPPIGEGVDALRTAAAAWAANEPWTLWRPPGGELRANVALTRVDFPRVAPPRERDVSYADCVREALDAIAADEVVKVVIARREFAAPADPVATVAALLERFPTCWVFAISDGAQVFLGATPELLVRVDGLSTAQPRLETVALAGTAAPGDDALLHSEKDLREHQLVVAAVHDAIAPHCTHVDVSPVRLLVLPNVQHLQTPIAGTLRPGTDPRVLVDALHPTPAVCGTPRAAARAVIDRIEPFERRLFAGVVGLAEDDHAEYVVALRSALLTRDRTELYAGAGIVRGSDPDAEDQETLRKLEAVRGALRFV